MVGVKSSAGPGLLTGLVYLTPTLLSSPVNFNDQFSDNELLDILKNSNLPMNGNFDFNHLKNDFYNDQLDLSEGEKAKIGQQNEKEKNDQENDHKVDPEAETEDEKQVNLEKKIVHDIKDETHMVLNHLKNDVNFLNTHGQKLSNGPGAETVPGHETSPSTSTQSTSMFDFDLENFQNQHHMTKRSIIDPNLPILDYLSGMYRVVLD